MDVGEGVDVTIMPDPARHASGNREDALKGGDRLEDHVLDGLKEHVEVADHGRLDEDFLYFVVLIDEGDAGVGAPDVEGDDLLFHSTSLTSLTLTILMKLVCPAPVGVPPAMMMDSPAAMPRLRAILRANTSISSMKSGILVFKRTE